MWCSTVSRVFQKQHTESLKNKLHVFGNLQLLSKDPETQIARTESPDSHGKLCSNVALSNVPDPWSDLASGIHTYENRQPTMIAIA
jgi:hypothetical protein